LGFGADARGGALVLHSPQPQCHRRSMPRPTEACPRSGCAMETQADYDDASTGWIASRQKYGHVAPGMYLSNSPSRGRSIKMPLTGRPPPLSRRQTPTLWQTETRYRGVVRRGRGGDGVPHFFRQGGRVPHSPHFFGLKFVQKLVHCCNWLLNKTRYKIISVQRN